MFDGPKMWNEHYRKYVLTFLFPKISETKSLTLYHLSVSLKLIHGTNCVQDAMICYSSTKSWRDYIFTAVCLCVCLSGSRVTMAVAVKVTVVNAQTL